MGGGVCRPADVASEESAEKEEEEKGPLFLIHLLLLRLLRLPWSFLLVIPTERLAQPAAPAESAAAAAASNSRSVMEKLLPRGSAKLDRLWRLLPTARAFSRRTSLVPSSPSPLPRCPMPLQSTPATLSALAALTRRKPAWRAAGASVMSS